MMALHDKWEDHQSHPEGDIIICAKFQGNTSNNCWGISLRKQKLDDLNLLLVLEAKSGGHQISILSPLGTMNVPDLMAIHPIVVDDRPRWPTDIAIPRVTQLAKPKN